MNINSSTLPGVIGLALLLIPGGIAEAAPLCETGRLLDVQQATELVPTVQVGRTRRDKNGREWTTIAPPPVQKQTSYIVKLAVGGMIYSARSSGEFWGYDPSKLVVNSDIPVCVEPNRLVITRPDGKQYKPTIIRREWERSAPAGE